MLTGSVVDTLSAQEFQRVILDRASDGDLRAIAADLRHKSESLQELLCGDLSLSDRASLHRVLRWVFSTRRRADKILDAIGPEALAAAIAGLLDEGEPVADRIDRFDAALAGLDGAPCLAGPGSDLPFELLHFTSPDQYWLWTKWLWDPNARTGALALVTTEDVELGHSAPRGTGYLAVGRVTAFVEETGKAAGFTAVGEGLFGTDVFLAAVYGIHMYTVLRMQMTREFTKVIPPLPDLVRRLLGVYHLEG
ncbi:MAG: hypothetical protein ABR925_05875 [Acidimicrobiales bacterium]|jgi:hypothetical protein